MLAACGNQLSPSPYPLTSGAPFRAWVRAQKTPQSVVLRARIALLAADGLSNTRIAREVGVSRPTVILWRERFRQGGPESLTKPVAVEAMRIRGVYL